MRVPDFRKLPCEDRWLAVRSSLANLEIKHSLSDPRQGGNSRSEILGIYRQVSLFECLYVYLLYLFLCSYLYL